MSIPGATNCTSKYVVSPPQPRCGFSSIIALPLAVCEGPIAQPFEPSSMSSAVFTRPGATGMVSSAASRSSRRTHQCFAGGELEGVEVLGVLDDVERGDRQHLLDLCRERLRVLSPRSR